jgi:uncharacterized protein YcfL
MKKFLMILLASFALAACGDGARNSEANRDEDANETTEPGVGASGDNEDMNTSDTTNTTAGDTTATAPQATPAN